MGRNKERFIGILPDTYRWERYGAIDSVFKKLTPAEKKANKLKKYKENLKNNLKEIKDIRKAIERELFTRKKMTYDNGYYEKSTKDVDALIVDDILDIKAMEKDNKIYEKFIKKADHIKVVKKGKRK